MNFEIFNEPDRKQWPSLTRRAQMGTDLLRNSVGDILQKVKEQGDTAVKELTFQFDGFLLHDLAVSEFEIREAVDQVEPGLKQAILQAKANITAFHEAQVCAPLTVETMPGIICSRRSVAVEKVGLYIPGGSAPLFSTVLMLAVPANIAGCKEILLCTPCDKNGKVHPAVLFTASICGVTKIFKIGGAQAIAAMAYGTATVPAVYKIFGPGNQWVTCAKQLVSAEGVAIDMPAGPSEVAVYANRTSIPAFVAADLLSQAEHGPDSQALLIASSAEIARAVTEELKKQIARLDRQAAVLQSLSNSRALIFADEAVAFDFINEYAPEHLIIATDNAQEAANRVTNAGSVFLGRYSAESIGDYASGTNHTLPTYGYAKAFSGVSVDSFVKKITFQEVTARGLEKIGRTVETMALAEGLGAHANAVSIRLNSLS